MYAIVESSVAKVRLMSCKLQSLIVQQLHFGFFEKRWPAVILYMSRKSNQYIVDSLNCIPVQLSTRIYSQTIW